MITIIKMYDGRWFSKRSRKKLSQSCSDFMAGYHCTNVNNTDNRFKPQLQPPIVNSFKYYGGQKMLAVTFLTFK
jgi:hypothetical protein